MNTLNTLVPTKSDATALARNAKGALKDLFNVSAGHAQALSLVARTFGFASSNALLAHVKDKQAPVVLDDPIRLRDEQTGRAMREHLENAEIEFLEGKEAEEANETFERMWAYNDPSLFVPFIDDVWSLMVAIHGLKDNNEIFYRLAHEYAVYAQDDRFEGRQREEFAVTAIAAAQVLARALSNPDHDRFGTHAIKKAVAKTPILIFNKPVVGKACIVCLDQEYVDFRVGRVRAINNTHAIVQLRTPPNIAAYQSQEYREYDTIVSSPLDSVFGFDLRRIKTD